MKQKKPKMLCPNKVIAELPAIQQESSQTPIETRALLLPLWQHTFLELSWSTKGTQYFLWLGW
jgi:hypothetical protein